MQNRTLTTSYSQDYDKDNDQHVFAIDKLVHELRLPAEEVNRSYREILEDLLKKDVPVSPLLPLLVSIGVKNRLKGSC